MTYDAISTTASRLTKAMQERNRIDAKISRRSKLLVAAERRRDTRRKILVGAVLIAAAETDPALQKTIQQLLETGLTRPHDRALFELSPLSPDATTGDTPSSQAPDNESGVGAPLLSLATAHRRATSETEVDGKSSSALTAIANDHLAAAATAATDETMNEGEG